MTVRIAHISDLHVSPEKPHFNANLATLFDELGRSRPDILLNTGDLGLYGEKDNGDLAFAKAAHQASGITFHITPGNHDIGEHPAIPKRVHVDEASLGRYRAKIGPDSWVLDLPGWRLVGLNSLIVGTGLSGDLEQLEMLRKASADRAGRALALVMHKPLADLDYADTSVNGRFTTHGSRQLILQAVGPKPADLVLCGHVHQYRDSRMGGSRHIWAPAASFVIGDPWQPTYGGKALGYLEHLFHADGSHACQLKTVRDLVHHDLAVRPDIYGDVTARGPGNG
jgi:3',5'-cyclic-AMP phosphodiesterase